MKDAWRQIIVVVNLVLLATIRRGTQVMIGVPKITTASAQTVTAFFMMGV